MTMRINIILKSMFLLAASIIAADYAGAERLVLLHTNDTHSQLDPADDGQGGIFRRKVLIDSIRQAEPNVMLIDAGDAVQGTLFFNLYGGVAEHKMMNFLGYDLAILGNHDFDNGSHALARNLANDSAVWITTNYDLRGGELDQYFKPYFIKKIGDKKVGFIGINLDPKGMIAEGNYDGVKYLDAIKAANATAWHLKHNERVDKVVAVTHIGYEPIPGPGDVELAKSSEDIDLIIGGHSHTLIDPSAPDNRYSSRIPNAVGDTVTIAQVGKSGKYLGEISIDLDSNEILYRVIPVNSRLDTRIDPSWPDILRPYRHGVDSLMNVKVGSTPVALKNDEAPLLNLVSDFVLDRGNSLSDRSVDLAIVNKGGIRRSLPKGAITEGMIMMMLPFNNSVTVMDLKGSDLKEAIDIMGIRGGDGVSRGVNAVMESDGRCSTITINGSPLDTTKIYRLATIDYLANGGDYMEPLTRGTVVSRSDSVLYDDLIDWFRNTNKGKKVKIDPNERMHR